MPPDPDEPVTLTSATTEFKAATVARALESRGIPSRVYGALTTGFRAEAPGVANVMVLRKDLDRARAALAEIQAETEELDWSEAERYAPPDAQPAEPPPPGPIQFPGGRTLPPSERRWAWTLILVVLLPAGGFLTVIAAQMAADPVVKSLGPILIAVAVVMALWLLSTKREDEESDDGHN